MRWTLLAPGLAAAALVEAGAGVAAAGCLVRFVHVRDGSDVLFGMFVAAALAAGLADAVLVPGWVWDRGRFAIAPMLGRLIIAAMALALAAGAVALFLVMGVAGVAFREPPPGSVWVEEVMPVVTGAVVFAAAGATVGLGAAVAQAADAGRHPNPPLRGRTRSHVVGGVAGVFLTLGVLATCWGVRSWVPAMPAPSLLAALPVVSVLGGLPHNMLVLRDAMRRGDGVLDLRMAMPRAALCATILFLVGAGLLLTAA